MSKWDGWIDVEEELPVKPGWYPALWCLPNDGYNQGISPRGRYFDGQKFVDADKRDESKYVDYWRLPMCDTEDQAFDIAYDLNPDD